MPTDPAHGIAARPAALRELALTVRQVAGVLEQTAAVLATAGGMAAPAPDPVPRAAELLAADARAALLAGRVRCTRWRRRWPQPPTPTSPTTRASRNGWDSDERGRAPGRRRGLR